MHIHRQVGQQGEQAAASDLIRRGFTIVARNLRLEAVEIDLLARKGRVLLVVEVKTRASGQGPPPEASVGARKQAKLALAVRALAARFPTAELQVAVAAVRLAPPHAPVIVWFLDPLQA
ncbi:MAG: YraN family protein [Planctomycetota bacterium]